MNIQQITHQIRKQSKTFGRNLTLERAERKPEFSAFKAHLEKALTKQFRQVAQNDKLISDLLSFYKAEVNQNAKMYLNNEWFSLYEISDEEFEAYYEWSGTIGGQSALDKMGIRAKPFILRNPEILAYFKNRENLVIQSIDNTSKDILLGIIQEARSLYLTNYEIAQLIMERIPEIGQVRADLIARNELAHAVGTVEFETFARNEVKKVRWVTAMDDRVCPFCEPLHNSEQVINSRFISSVEGKTSTTTYNVNRPPLHVSCRCYLEEVIDGISVRDGRYAWTGN